MFKRKYASACFVLYTCILIPGCEFQPSTTQGRPSGSPQAHPPNGVKPTPAPPRPTPTRPDIGRPPPPVPDPEQPIPDPEPPRPDPERPPTRPPIPVGPVSPPPPSSVPTRPIDKRERVVFDGFCSFKNTKQTTEFRGSLTLDGCRQDCNDDRTCRFYAYAEKEFVFDKFQLTSICVLYDGIEDHEPDTVVREFDIGDGPEFIAGVQCYKFPDLYRKHEGNGVTKENICVTTTLIDLLIGVLLHHNKVECAEKCLQAGDCNYFVHSTDLSSCVIHTWSSCAEWTTKMDYFTYKLNVLPAKRTGAGTSSMLLYIGIALGVVFIAAVAIYAVKSKGKKKQKTRYEIREGTEKSRSLRPRSAHP